MQTLKIKKNKLRGFFVPFKYNNNLIYSLELELEDEALFGFYGFGKNTIYFIDIDELPEEIELELPDELEELQEFLGAVENIIQRISLNGSSIYIPSIDTTIETKYLLKPYVNFVRNYEENIRMIERLKYD